MHFITQASPKRPVNTDKFPQAFKRQAGKKEFTVLFVTSVTGIVILSDPADFPIGLMAITKQSGLPAISPSQKYKQMQKNPSPPNLNLFPTFDNVQELAAYVDSQIKTITPNQAIAMLVAFRNTLMKVL